MYPQILQNKWVLNELNHVSEFISEILGSNALSTWEDLRCNKTAAALDALPRMIKESKSDNTWSAYTHSFNAFRKWASDIPNARVWPANEQTIGLYLIQRSKENSLFLT